MADAIEPAEHAHSVAMDVILSRYDPDEIDDLDVRVSFEDDELTIDIYLLVAGEDTAPVVTEAIERAATAVDELLGDA